MLKVVWKKLKNDYKEYVVFMNKYDAEHYLFFTLMFSLFATLHYLKGNYVPALINLLLAIYDGTALYLAVKRRLKKKKVRN